MSRMPAHGRRIADQLVVASAIWAAVLFLIALVFGSGALGWGVLYFAAVPMALTVITALLLHASRRTGNPAYRMGALVPIGFVTLGVVVSFVLPLFALLPSCALLATACFEPTVFTARASPGADDIG